MKTITVISVLALLVSALAPSRAQLLFNLNPASLSGSTGDTLTFNATLTNAGPDTVFLNGDNANLFAPGLTLNDSLFFSNTPLFLASGDSFTGDIFQVTIGANAVLGPQIGEFDILGGADAAALDTVASQFFQVEVVSPASVPEPSLLALLCGITLPLLIGRFTRAPVRRR